MTREERRVNWLLCKRLCVIGLPMGLQYSVTAIGSTIMQAAVNTLGTLSVAAMTAGSKLFQLLCCPLDALGSTMAIYCGQNVGAGKPERLGQGLRASSLLGLCYALLAFGAMLLFAPQATMLFMDPNEAELSQIIALTSRYIITLTGFFFPLALVNIVRFSIQGMGFSLFAIFSGFWEMVARTVVAWWLVPVFGFAAVCFASPLAWVAADLFLIPACLRCISVLRKRLQPVPVPFSEES